MCNLMCNEYNLVFLVLMIEKLHLFFFGDVGNIRINLGSECFFHYCAWPGTLSGHVLET